MRLAPNPPLTVQTLQIASGSRGIHQTVRLIRSLINEYKKHPTIIQEAVSAIYHQPAKNADAEIGALLRYVQNRIRYVADPVGVESIAVPTTTLMRQVGDCDDSSCLLGAMLEAVGYPTKLVIAGYHHPGVYEHIYLRAWNGTEWIDLDPSEDGDIGYSPPNPVLLTEEP